MTAGTVPTFDIDALLQPIPGDRIGGEPRAYARGLRATLAESRCPPRSSNPEDPDKEGGAACVDWTAVTTTASEALIEQTKDLRVACHLTEAAMQHWGLAGLRDGLSLLRQLCQCFWEELSPELDADEPDARSSPLENLLDDPDRGPQLPTALRALPLLHVGTHTFSLLTATRQTDDMSPAEVAGAIRQVTVDDACQLSDELDGAIAELEAWQHELLERLGEYAPTFVHLQESLTVLRQWIDTVLEPQLNSRDQEGASSETAGPQVKSTAQVIASRPPSETDLQDAVAVVDRSQQVRADAYARLSDAADLLQRIEPHSPIPYMIHRAVELGQLPFPVLMHRLVSEESTLEMFQRELGSAGSKALTSLDND